jgi:hypothetical protein
MPIDAKRQPPPPLMQVAWTTKDKDRIRTVTITLGSPLPAIVLFLGGTQFGSIQKVARSIWTAFCASR